MNQLRILLVIPGNPEGSSMIFSRRQAAYLQALGADCKPFFLISRTSPTALISELRRFRNEVKAFKPDIIHADFGTMTGFFAAFATSMPLVITYRGTDLNPSVLTLRAIMGRLLSQIAALRARQIICVSEELRQRLWWKRRKVTVIPSGVDTSIFYPRDRDQVRSELRWTREEKIVIFNAGRTPKIKRLDLAQSSIEAARRICGDIRFVILDGFVDPSHIPKLMNAADCLLLTSDWEGSPTVAQEALACNLPLVSVDVGDIRERLAGVTPSYIVERDPNQIGRTIARILLKRERSNGSKMIDGLALGRLGIRVLSVYDRVVSKR